MTAVHVPKEPGRETAIKGGDGYSRCPYDDCAESEVQFTDGGRDSRGHEYRGHEIYNTNIKDGNCGRPWAVDTSEGLAKAHQQGRQPMFVSQQAGKATSYSLPSEAFKAGWDRIFGRPDAHTL